MVSVVVLVCAYVLIWCAWKVFDWVWWKPKRLERYFREQGIEGPSYKLIHGNLKENTVATEEAKAKPMNFSRHSIAPRVLPFLHQTVEKYGKLSLFWVGGIPRVNVMDPDLVREVLSNKFGHFTKMRPNPLSKLFISGLASYNGEKWARHRRIINPAFHQEKLKLMLSAFYACSDELISTWEKRTLEGSCELDVVPEFQQLTGDGISRAAFGSNYEQGRRIFELQTQQLELFTLSFQSAYIPGSRFLPTKRNKRMKDIHKEASNILRGMIKEREKAIRLGEVHNEDLLNLLIDSNIKEIQEHKNAKNNGGMSVEDIIEECKLFYFAGQETTSTLLVWTIVLLSMHQEWQKRAREEVLQAFGTNKPDFDGLSHLKIVPMILYEVLRLYPPVTFLMRYTDKPMKLGEINVPSGVLIGLPILLIHHNRDIWGEDAEEFNPERFSGGISKAAKYKSAFFPFGWGPRICIGQQFAIMEAKIALTMILQHFSFELSSTYVHAPHLSLTLQPQHGAQVVFHKL
ncbi:hypothetical protein Scep_028382 [Stephania cephalantha]|uniref:Cytochrome P450 n=1 Tax=Stephania cephalantha TaxID=152367 RepID=A0AAP0EC10_9MAGN